MQKLICELPSFELRFSFALSSIFSDLRFPKFNCEIFLVWFADRKGGTTPLMKLNINQMKAKHLFLPTQKSFVWSSNMFDDAKVHLGKWAGQNAGNVIKWKNFDVKCGWFRFQSSLWDLFIYCIAHFENYSREEHQIMWYWCEELLTFVILNIYFLSYIHITNGGKFEFQ